MRGTQEKGYHHRAPRKSQTPCRKLYPAPSKTKAIPLSVSTPGSKPGSTRGEAH